MYLEPSQGCTGDIARVACKNILPVGDWGTRKGMVQPAEQALDKEVLRQLGLRVHVLRKGRRHSNCQRTENRPETGKHLYPAPWGPTHIWPRKLLQGTEFAFKDVVTRQTADTLWWLVWPRFCFTCAFCLFVWLVCFWFFFFHSAWNKGKLARQMHVKSNARAWLSHTMRCCARLCEWALGGESQRTRSTLGGHGLVHKGNGICFISRVRGTRVCWIQLHWVGFLHNDIPLVQENAPLNISRKIICLCSCT